MPDRKTLVFSFDGTGNQPGDAKAFKKDESISNVLKLHVLMGGGIDEDGIDIRTPEGNPQQTHYYSGIGTGEKGRSIPLLGSLISLVDETIAPEFGDAERILEEAEQDFKDAGYAKGDTLVVFGFSRGAALARRFASSILASHTQCEVSFLGVFDTVAAMSGVHSEGDPIRSDVVFEHGTLNERINRAVHIVSLDEDRVSFTPTLINKDADHADRILEVWFPGVHSDIGGSYWFDGLSDVTLQFMIDECKKALKQRIVIHQDNASIRTLFQKQGSALSALDVDDIAIHPLPHGMMHEHSGVWDMVPRKPRHVYVSDNDQPSEQEDDIPILHHTVMRRFAAVPSYRPPALRGLRFRFLLENGRQSKAIQGISGLRTLKLPT